MRWFAPKTVASYTSWVLLQEQPVDQQHVCPLRAYQKCRISGSKAKQLNAYLHFDRTPRLLKGILQSGKLRSKLQFESVGPGKYPGLCMCDKSPAHTCIINPQATLGAAGSNHWSQTPLHTGINLGRTVRKCGWPVSIFRDFIGMGRSLSIEFLKLAS